MILYKGDGKGVGRRTYTYTPMGQTDPLSLNSGKLHDLGECRVSKPTLSARLNRGILQGSGEWDSITKCLITKTVRGRPGGVKTRQPGPKPFIRRDGSFRSLMMATPINDSKPKPMEYKT